MLALCIFFFTFAIFFLFTFEECKLVAFCTLSGAYVANQKYFTVNNKNFFVGAFIRTPIPILSLNTVFVCSDYYYFL